ncbi:MAG: hypothetical protein ACI31A_01115 [Candidatus Limisoma sp.]
MCGDKAIVLATGEIVTINCAKEEDGDTVYTILEDVHRKFIADELRLIDDKWAFIMKWHPDYNCDEVAYSDDIDCCLAGEADEERLESVKALFGKTPEQWQTAQIEIDADLLDESVDNYYQRIFHRPRSCRE